MGVKQDAPVLMFFHGDDGRARAGAAFRRETRFGRSARFFLIVAFVSAPIWLVSEFAQRWIDVFGHAASTGFERDFHLDRLQLWSDLSAAWQMLRSSSRSACRWS